MGAGGIFLLILGGVIYTAGGYVYTTEQPNPYVLLVTVSDLTSGMRACSSCCCMFRQVPWPIWLSRNLARGSLLGCCGALDDDVFLCSPVEAVMHV